MFAVLPWTQKCSRCQVWKLQQLLNEWQNVISTQRCCLYFALTGAISEQAQTFSLPMAESSLENKELIYASLQGLPTSVFMQVNNSNHMCSGYSL